MSAATAPIASRPAALGTSTAAASSLGLQALPVVLSVIAGSADVISFLALDLFSAHITGNLAILAAHVVGGGSPHFGQLLSIPVFILAAGVTRAIAAGLENGHIAALRPLLLLQLVLLAGFLVLGVAAGPGLDADAPIAILAGMLGVAAMAVQNALVQVALPGTPSTAVMTTNATRFAIDIVEVLRSHPGDASNRARRTGLIILGFAIGCGLGAFGVAAVGLWALMVPTGLAAIALVIGIRLMPALQAEPQGPKSLTALCESAIEAQSTARAQD